MTMRMSSFKYQTETVSLRRPRPTAAVAAAAAAATIEKLMLFATILNFMVLPVPVHTLSSMSISMSMSSTPNSGSNSKSTNSSNNSINNSYISGAEKLRQLLSSSRKRRTTATNNATNNASARAIVVPGIHDALSAKIFANAGAPALFLSGFGVTASKLGQPDVGLLTQTEMEDTVRSVVQALNVNSDSNANANVNTNTGAHPPPLIVDGDTGFGGPLNIRRTIRSFASAGAAAVTIEDQQFPKKCTYAAGKHISIISQEECIERIQIAVAARNEVRDGDILIIARTDCRAALGLDEAVKRCQLFQELGADIVYAENLQSKSEYEYLRNCLSPSTSTMLAQVQLVPSNGDDGNDGKDGDGDDTNDKDDEFKSKQVLFSADEIGEMGYDLALYGVTALQSVVYALKETASDMLLDTNTSTSTSTNTSSTSSSKSGLVHHVPLTPFSELKESVGFPEAEEFLKSKFSTNR